MNKPTQIKMRRCKECDKPLKYPKMNKSGYCTPCGESFRYELKKKLKKQLKEQKQ